MDEDKSRRRNVHPPQPGPAAGQKHDADPRHGKHEGEDLDDDDAAFSSSSRPDSTEASALHADRAVVIPAADVNGGDTVKIGIEPPTFEQVVKFMLPTLGMLLANPILSMVDTAFVGRYNNRQSLGALAPSTAACDQAIYLASIISVATTNLFADAMAKHDIRGARRVVASTITLAAVLGAILGLILFFGGEALMRLLAGDASEDVVPLALQYVYVRAVGTSFSLVSIVAQSACIGARDSISPLVGVCIQSLANVAGDWLLVGVMGWGVAGAAWATIAAQLLGMIYLCTKMSVLLASMQSQAEAMCPSGRAAETERLYFWGLAAVPTTQEIMEVSRFCAPLFLVRLCVSYYWSSCAYAAGAGGTVALASHQVLIGMFWLFTMGGEALSVSAQAYFPAFKERQRVAILTGRGGGKETDDVNTLFYTFLAVSGVMAVFLSLGAVFLAAYFANGFSSDTLVIENVRHVSMLLGLAVLPNCPCIMIEGVLTSSRDLNFLGTVDIFNAFVWTYFLRWMRASAPRLDVLYTGLVVFQSVRFIQWAGRLWYAGPSLGVPVFGRKPVADWAKQAPEEMKPLTAADHGRDEHV